MFRRMICFMPIFLVLASRASADPRSIPSQTFPDPFGVNIHFTHAKPGEMKALAAAYKVARMDFAWSSIEKRKGEYDFSDYDYLVRDLEANGVRPLLILDYGNDLYGKGPVRTAEQRKAYAAFAAAAAMHFKGHRIMWEFWNEPNGDGFWGGRPDAGEYASMVLEAAPAMRKADSKCTLLVGAFSGFPWSYIETVFAKGCLKWADAVSVHPYRSGYPETAGRDYQILRRYIAGASPKREIPIISGEWGYSTNTRSGVPELRQAQYLVRQRLYNVRSGILTSIWYDWKDDGPNPEENEHRFGSTRQDFAPKPAYQAALTMSRELSGYSYVRMLEDGPDLYVMLLRNDRDDSAIAYWSTGPEREYRLPSRPKRVVGMLGDTPEASQTSRIGPSPSYAFFGADTQVDSLAGWNLKGPTTITAGQPWKGEFSIRNTGDKTTTYDVAVRMPGGKSDPDVFQVKLRPGRRAKVPVTLELWDRSPEAEVPVTVSSGDARYSATVRLVVTNPVAVSAAPAGSGLTVSLDAPGIQNPETLSVKATDASGRPIGAAVPVALQPGTAAYSAQLRLSLPADRAAYGIAVMDRQGRRVATLPPTTVLPVISLAASTVGEAPSGLAVHAEGDEKPGGSASLEIVADPRFGKVADLQAVFPDGWRYFVVTPDNTQIPDTAVAVGMWVDGDASGDDIRVRFIDAKGQTYQPSYGQVTWKGWRWISMPLTDPTVGSWGGPQDGVIHRPIKWDSVFLLDSNSRKAHSARIRFAGLNLITR